MATLNPFLGPHDGPMRIFVYYGRVSLKVGDGNFTEVTDFTADFDGHYKIDIFNVIKAEGKIKVAVELKDHDPNAPSGPCSITIDINDNHNTDPNASYRIQGEKLVVSTTLNGKPIAIYKYEKGTKFDNIQPPKVEEIGIWIGP